MTEHSKVLILCPAATISGGPEALHQFCGALRAQGVDAAMVYYPTARGGLATPVPYRRYGVVVCPSAVDGLATVVVIPEVVTSMIWQFPLARKAIWWLSIDNYFKWQHLNPGPSVFAPRADLIHLCQSHYAREFLAGQHMGPLLMLTDFITESAFSPGETARRIPVAAYNPKRNSAASRRILAKGESGIWLPLENITRAALAEVLREVRLYVDFGPHPGRDRLPREAALSGAVVITGRQGSAGFTEDLPLPERFRLDEKTADFETRGLAFIDELLHSDTAFLEALAEQAPYREWIGCNKAAFLAEVDTFIAAMGPREQDSWRSFR